MLLRQTRNGRRCPPLRLGRMIGMARFLSKELRMYLHVEVKLVPANRQTEAIERLERLHRLMAATPGFQVPDLRLPRQPDAVSDNPNLAGRRGARDLPSLGGGKGICTEPPRRTALGEHGSAGVGEDPPSRTAKVRGTSSCGRSTTLANPAGSISRMAAAATIRLSRRLTALSTAEATACCIAMRSPRVRRWYSNVSPTVRPTTATSKAPNARHLSSRCSRFPSNRRSSSAIRWSRRPGRSKAAHVHSDAPCSSSVTVFTG